MQKVKDVAKIIANPYTLVCTDIHILVECTALCYSTTKTFFIRLRYIRFFMGEMIEYTIKNNLPGLIFVAHFDKTFNS